MRLLAPVVLVAACKFPELPPIVEIDATDTDAAGVDAPTDGAPTCSGLRVAFDDGLSPAKDVYTSALDGSDRIPLAPHAGIDYAVTGSPQAFVAFTTNRDGNLDVYRVNADGTGLINLTMTAADDGLPVFSPDGSRIAFARGGALWVMNVDGSMAHAVSAGSSYEPRWSPDGTRLAFQLVNGSEGDLWVVGADGSSIRQLTSAAGFEGGQSWSPDGTKIGYSAAGDLHVVNADGTADVNLTNDAAMQYSAEWSPDGTKMAFSDGGQIKVMPSGGGPRTVISAEGFSDIRPLWSPDGTKLLWTRQYPPAFNDRHVVVSNADGTLPTVPFGGPADYVGSVSWVSCR